MSLTPPLPYTALPLRADEKEYQLCYNAFDSESREGDTIQSRKSLYAIAQRKNVETHVSFYYLVHLFSRGRGHPWLGNHGASRSRQALRAVSCLLRGDSRFLSDASSIAGARVATRAFTSIPCESSRQFTSHSSAAGGSGGLG